MNRAGSSDVTRLGAAFVALATAWAIAQTPLAPLHGADHPDRVPGEYIVVLHEDGALAAQGLAPQELTTLAGVDVRSRFGIDGPSGFVSSSPPSSDGGMQGPLAPQDDARRTSLRGFTADLNDDALRRIRRDPSVRYVEASTTLKASGRDLEWWSWGLDRIDQRDQVLDGRFEVDWPSEGRWVYVVDSGVRRTHPELEGRVRQYSSVILDDDYGADDCTGHGTAVASQIAGRTVGVVTGANLWSVRVLDCSGTASTAGIVTALTWLSENAIPGIVNMSLGGSGWSPTFGEAIREGRARGFLYVAAAGNENEDACGTFPAAYPGVVAVGATDRLDARASFSNYGPCVDVWAPGRSVPVATIGSADGDIALFSGTSMAAPYVSGVAALHLWGPEPETLLEDCVTEDVLSDVRGAPNRLIYARLDLCTERPTAPISSFPGTLIPPGGELQDREPEFRWSRSYGEVAPIEGYEFGFYDASDGRVVHRESNLSRTEATVPLQKLSPGRTYRWDVRAFDRYGPGPRSQSRYVVRPPTGVPHDQFTDARLISGTSGLLVGSNEGASFEANEPDHTLDTFTEVGPFDRASVWYVWEAPTDGRAVFTTGASEIDALVAAYVENVPGAGLEDVTDVGRDDDLSDPPVRIEFQAEDGLTYFVAVDSYGGTGAYEIAWRVGDPPTNDGLQQATILGDAEGSVQGSNEGADSHPDEPDPTQGAGGTVQGSVWYEWEAPAQGPVTFEVTGLDAAPVLAAYRQPLEADGYAGLTPVATDPDPLDGSSVVWFEARRGVRYLMAIDTIGTTGSFELTWHSGRPGLEVSVTGVGRVTSAPAGIDCPNGGACTASFAPGTVVTLRAEGIDGTSVRDWSGCRAVVGTECLVTIDGPTSVDATFARVDRGTPTCEEAWYAANPLGDMDRDGTLSSGDALRTFLVALGQARVSNAYERHHADVDGDESVSPQDALAALRRSAGDPRGARLRIVPHQELQVDPGGDACLVVFNAAAGPLPSLIVETSQGVVASEIVDTERPNFGRVFRVSVMSGTTEGEVEVTTDGAGRVAVPVRVR